MSKYQEYLPIYEGDRYCLMCGQACPVRRVTSSEATSPHGWALLVTSLERGVLPWSAEAVNVLYQCADCGNCQGNCATDRPLPYAIQAARANAVSLGHAPAGLDSLDEKLRTWGNPYGETTANNSSSVPDSSSATVLFIGDGTFFLKPQLVDAATTLLQALGISVMPIRTGSSSGYLPYTLGLWETARQLAKETVEAIRAAGAVRVIVLSPQDAHTLKNVYPELGVAMSDGATITTLVDVLANAGETLKIRSRDAVPYTYHDPSEAVRLKSHALNARVLATMVMGSEPVEMLYRENLATPIGTSGGLQYTQPALAEKWVRTRIGEAKETGTKIILTDDPVDTARLEQYADGIEVLNLYQLLEEQLDHNK